MINHMKVRYLAAALLGVVLQSGPVSAGDAPVTITLIGDAHINGDGLNPPDRFAARMTAALANAGVTATIQSAGIRHSTDLGLFWLTQMPEGQALLAAPAGQAVILELGMLDCYGEGTEIALDKTRANFEQMLDILHDKGIPVLLVGAETFGHCGKQYGTDDQSLFPLLASLRGLPFYPDFREGVAGHPELVQQRFDCAHPNEAGEQLVAEKMLPMVLALVADVGKPLS